MEEIRRPQIDREGRRHRSGFWNQGSAVEDPGNAMATVTHGPYAEQIPVAEMTVGQVRQRYGDRFDIAPESQPYLDGEPVSDDVVVRDGQVLMFTRRAGEKGVGRDCA